MQLKPLEAVAATLMALIFLFGAVSAHAAPDEASDGRIVVESKEADVGDTLTVLISLKDHPGVAAFEFHVTYDPQVLELTDKAAKDVSGIQFSDDNAAQPYKCIWSDASQKNVTGDCDICELTFRVKAVTGPQTTVSVSYAAGDVYRTENQRIIDVNPETVDGVIAWKSVPYDIQLAERTDSEATFALTNQFTVAASVCFVVAAYNADGRMLYGSVENAALEPSQEIRLSAPVSEETARVKAFALDASAFSILAARTWEGA